MTQKGENTRDFRSNKLKCVVEHRVVCDRGTSASSRWVLVDTFESEEEAIYYIRKVAAQEDGYVEVPLKYEKVFVWQIKDIT
jgi:hypothetical protein